MTNPTDNELLDDASVSVAEEIIDKSDLTVGPLDKHLKRLAIPASIGFFFHILFNVTDTFVAGKISTDALAALAFSFPLFFVIITFSVGLTQATSALIGRAKGANKMMRGKYYIGQVVVCIILVSLPIMIFGNYFARAFLNALGATPIQLELAHDYIVWLYSLTPLFIIPNVLSGILSSHGDTHTFRNALVTASILNLLFDPMLAFGWFGLPALGVEGIAIATIIAEIIIIAWMGIVAYRLTIIKDLRGKHFMPRKRGVIEVFLQAYPPTLNMVAINFGFVINTYYLASIDSIAVAAYGIALRIEQLVLLLTIGLNIGLLAIASQNFGAKKYERLIGTYKIANKYGLIITVIGGIFMVVLGQFMISLFNNEEIVIKYGYEYLITATLIGPFYIFAHNATAMLQAIAKPAMIGPFGAIRLIILPLLFCWLFVTIFEWGTVGVWTSLFIANASVTFLIYFYTKKKLVNCC